MNRKGLDVYGKLEYRPTLCSHCEHGSSCHKSWHKKNTCKTSTLDLQFLIDYREVSCEFDKI